MTSQSSAEDSTPHRMTCVRRLYVLQDEVGRTWLAAEDVPGTGGTGDPGESPVEGGAMSHRVAGDDSGPGPEGGQGGGAMSHLVPGDEADVDSGDLDQVTVLVPAKPGLLPHRMRAYRVSPALLPTGAEPPPA